MDLLWGLEFGSPTPMCLYIYMFELKEATVLITDRGEGIDKRVNHCGLVGQQV